MSISIFVFVDDDEEKQIHMMNVINDFTNNYLNIGLINRGNTCYLNCIIQLLYRFKGLRFELSNTNFTFGTMMHSMKRLFLMIKHAINDVNPTGTIIDFLQSKHPHINWIGTQYDVVEKYHLIMRGIVDDSRTYSDANDRVFDMNQQIYTVIDPTTIIDGHPYSRFLSTDHPYDQELTLDAVVPENYHETFTLMHCIEQYFFDVCLIYI